MSVQEVKNQTKCWSLLAAMISFSIISASTFAVTQSNIVIPLNPEPQHSKSTCVILSLIDRAHYRRKPLDNKLSSIVFKRFLKNLDSNHSVFLASDIKFFKQYEYKLDDALLNSNLFPAFDIYNRYRQRINERAIYALKAIKGKFNFTRNERYQFDRSKSAWVSSKKSLDRIWYKRIKNDYLNLKLAGKKHKAILVTLRKRYERLQRRNQQVKAEDVFQQFMNAYTLSIEPHTSYFSPDMSEDFKIHMSQRLEGIGAALGVENEHTVIRKIIKGGPAAKSHRLHKEDAIIGVAQGNGKMEDIVGWRLGDVVRLIRGKKGSVVRLLVLPKGVISAKPKTVVLVRNKIKLQAQAAKSSIITLGKGAQTRRIGVITLPTFYLDFEAEQSTTAEKHGTTRDVRIILAKLKAARVDGVLIDLRGNGGGSLLEAIRLTGLFIRSGPVVQIRSSQGTVHINRDPDPQIVYAGPLAVLVDHGSASASEIFAGAIKDYRRGLIIGHTTFGKGTVQQIFRIKDYLYPSRFGSRVYNRLAYGKKGRQCESSANLPKAFGQLKLTIAQFFRINGESTQHRGVTPDIRMPSLFGYDDQGESSLKHAIPWARISPASYNIDRLSVAAVNKARSAHSKRIKHSVAFKYFNKLSKLYRQIKKEKYISLLESSRTATRKKREATRLSNENKLRVALGMKPKSAKDKHDVDEKNPSQLIILNEAALILSDYIAYSLRLPLIGTISH
ncbi:tail-specific protease [hydrothermal vent metagenome]|uniref:Tail-specific protease n=1 Tax=hydrothermal vent metagenome TaxID=652676 RepID=A0A3B0ZJZ0_9ZZZZ